MSQNSSSLSARSKGILIVVFTAIGAALLLGLSLTSCNGMSSSSGTPTTPPPPPPPSSGNADVLTYHNDKARTGQNLAETVLTLSNVNSSSFGKLFTIPTDGKIDAQPLYISRLIINQTAHNVLIIASEHGTVYAFDADNGNVLWQTSMLQSGETPSDDHSCGQISPEIGVTATPVIDRTAGPHGTVYVVAMSKDGAGNYHQRLHALDITTGDDQLGGPREITATYPGNGDNSSGGVVTFDPRQYAERTGLLLLNEVIYTTWTSHCDARPYTGWLMSFDQHTLAQISVLNVTPNGTRGAIWMAGGGPAADNSGNIYLLTGNGDFDTNLNGNGFPTQANYGNSFLKISTTNKQMAVADYFEMHDQAAENAADADLGSGGVVLLPDLTDGSGKVWHLAAGAGKDTHIYLVDRDNMGKFTVGSNNIYQQLSGALPGGIWSMPAYFNQKIYYGAVGRPMKAFTLNNARMGTTPSSQTANTFAYPGTSPKVSANGSSNGIIWAVENSSTAVLHAYDAADLLHELYNSNQASGGRDHFGPGNKFVTPMIANGRVFVGTTTGVGVFGLLN